MNENYTDVKEKAAQWGLTLRQVQFLCARGKTRHARTLPLARPGLHELDAREEPADLVLPSAARLHLLLERKRERRHAPPVCLASGDAQLQ